MKHEFEKLIGYTISAERYEIVQNVYRDHSQISDVNGKIEISHLWNEGGISLIEAIDESIKCGKPMDLHKWLDLPEVRINPADKIRIDSLIEKVINISDNIRKTIKASESLKGLIESIGNSIFQLGGKIDYQYFTQTIQQNFLKLI